LVIDFNVHQGNGTAAIFQADPSVSTFSMHGERNFPTVKEGRDPDMQIPDGTGDDYLEVLINVLSNKLPFDTADLVFYLAGADCF